MAKLYQLFQKLFRKNLTAAGNAKLVFCFGFFASLRAPASNLKQKWRHDTLFRLSASIIIMKKKFLWKSGNNIIISKTIICTILILFN